MSLKFYPVVVLARLESMETARDLAQRVFDFLTEEVGLSEERVGVALYEGSEEIPSVGFSWDGEEVADAEG